MLLFQTILDTSNKGRVSIVGWMEGTLVCSNSYSQRESKN